MTDIFNSSKDGLWVIKTCISLNQCMYVGIYEDLLLYYIYYIIFILYIKKKTFLDFQPLMHSEEYMYFLD